MSKIVCQSHDCKIDLQKKRLKPTLSTKTPRKGAAIVIQYTRLYGERERENVGEGRGVERGKEGEKRGGEEECFKFSHLNLFTFIYTMTVLPTC